MHELHLVLHGLAIKKHASSSEISTATGLALNSVTTLLEQAVTTGRAASAGNKYMLTAAGRMIIESQYSRYYDGERRNKQFISAYEKFEMINVELKRLITDWQTKEVGGKRISNDHTDSEYDFQIIDRLGGIHEKIEPVLDELARYISRLTVYKNKLEFALTKAEDGDIQWVSDAKIGSYHTVWFELHEELLRILGREREE